MTVRQAARRTVRVRVRRPIPDAKPAPPVEVPEEEPLRKEKARPVREKPSREVRRWRILVSVLALLLVGAVAAATVYGQRWYQRSQVEAAHEQALAAARQVTVDFVSISASSVDRDLQRIAAGATGEFKDEFTRGMSQVRAAVVENNVDSHGTVLRAGLVSGDRDSAVVLVAVDATVKNVRAPEGRLSHYRIQVDVTKVHSGQWLVSRLQFIG
jgi:Mce-associated membrane protein